MNETPDNAPPGQPAGPGAWPAFRRLLLGLLVVVFIGTSGWIGFTVAERQGIAALRQESNHRLDLFSAAVEGVINRLEHVPATVQLNQDVLALLRRHAPAHQRRTASDYLRRLNAHLGSMSVFVLDDRGIVLASSNTDVPDDSRLGEDLSFRPYFLDALSGRVGRHFAIGVHGGEPGYFVSHPIRDGARVVGVATIKIGLQAIDKTWEMLSSQALLADTNQVVIMSSQPEWRYTSLADLSVDRRVDLQLSRLYNNRRIERFPLVVQLSIDEDSQVIEGVLPGGAPPGRHTHSPEMLVLGRTLDGMDWRLMMFTDLRPTRRQAAVMGTMSAMGAAFVVLLALYLAQRRRIQRQRQQARRMLEEVNAELEQKVARRTQDLTDTNDRLRKEVSERERAEQTLRNAQGELVHTAKMAILGQLATGITHELTQPLGAIRTLSGNAAEFLKRGDLQSLSGNLGIIARMADQMGNIIQPLKGFARKSQPVAVQTDIAHAIGNALFLYGPRMRKDEIQLQNHCVAGQVTAFCDPNRLEQVLINLIGNAIDAMSASPERTLTLQADRLPANTPPPHLPAAACAAGWVRVDVLDTGSGLDEAVRDHLFEPFFTTKANGQGLGLGLVISRDIAREFHGEIDAAPRPGGGARFSLYLPAGPVGPNHAA